MRRTARFENFEFDIRAAELRREGATNIQLSDQPFQILVMLLERPGDVVTRDEIRSKLWPNGTVVEFEHSINAAMNRLRQALDDSAEKPRYIETLARRGYRWKVPVQWVEAHPEDVAAHPASPARSATRESLIGRKVSHYRVIAPLGGGGMGIVYRAEDLKLGRAVALKFLPEELADSPVALGRFEREARAASALNHPNICTIYAVEEHEGQPFIAMELLEGQTLRELIAEPRISTDNKVQKSPLQLPRFLGIAVQIAQGLEAAHKKGIIHRDIKPANIFITTHGQAKILDFGLAKLQESDSLDQSIPVTSERAPNPEGDNSISLTTTGTTVGTAGYMSPEQVRGDKVDARTDLFSLGVVLYEIVTGQRAFPGESVAVLRNAILHETPAPVRELNPQVSPRLEAIVNRTLEKDPKMRFQSAGELREQLLLEMNSVGKKSQSSGRLRLAALAAVVLLLAGMIYLTLTRHRITPARDPKIRQLTINSSENQVFSGAISRDGKYLVYSDLKGMHVMSVDTGETKPVPLPGENSKQGLVMQASFSPWLPDDNHLLVTVHPPRVDWTSHDASIWIVPTSGGSPRKLRENAVAEAISPDGSLIAFTTAKGRFYDRELWLMGSNGEQARKIAEVGENSWFMGLVWSADSRQVIYRRIDGPTNGNIHSTNAFSILSLAEGSQSVTIPTDLTQNWRDLAWLPDGDLVVSVREPRTVGWACNFWLIRLDLHTGQPLESPRRLTDSTQSCIGGPTVSNDGERLAYFQTSSHATIYMADLESGRTAVANVSHFTLTESSDYVQDWTADGKAALFVSRRRDSSRLFKQNLNSDTPEELMSVADDISFARVSPDGKWIVAVITPSKGVTGNKASAQLIRLPIAGGVPQVILQGRPIDQFFCARAPASLCAVAEQSPDNRHVVITAFDPEKGLGPELVRFDVDPKEQTIYGDLSPDGTRLAFTVGSDPDVRIISLRGQPEVRVPMGKLGIVRSLNWTTDGKGLFISSSSNETELWHLDLRGKASHLWTSQSGVDLGFNIARPSPDGRHIAVQSWVTNSNIWMMENFTER